jgi:phage-related holin
MDYINQFISLVDGVKITTLVALIIANFILGVAVSIKLKTFNFKQLGEFLYTRVLPYVVGYFGVGVIATIDSAWSWAVTAVWAVILATMVGAIAGNLKELGIPIPDILPGKKEG